MPPIPQTNPKANYEAHKAEIDIAIEGVLESGWYVLGKNVSRFESEFCAWLGSESGSGIGVASGTDAIVLALKGIGIGPGHLVATVSHTAVATVAAIEMAGADALLVDVDPETFCMSTEKLRSTIADLAPPDRERLAAIIPVHLYGHPADMDAIMAASAQLGVPVIEDCAQAHGAKIAGQPVGTFGRAAAFSFYPTKNLGCLGDGGFVLASNQADSERIRSLREYGWAERYVSAYKGMNSRLDELQAAVLLAKLPHLKADNEKRKQLAARYDRGLAATSLKLPERIGDVEHAVHQYVVRTPRRDSLRAFLGNRGIGTLVHYPVPIHLQPAYTQCLRGDMSVTEEAARTVLSLPMFPELSPGDVDTVCAAIAEWDASGQ